MGGWESLDYTKSRHAIQDFGNGRQKKYDLEGSRVTLNTTVLCSINKVSPLPEGSSILHLITLPCCHKSRLFNLGPIYNFSCIDSKPNHISTRFILTLIKQGLDRGEDGAQKALRHTQPRHIEQYEQERLVATDPLSLHNEKRGEERL